MADTIKNKGQYDYNDLAFVMERLPAGVRVVEAIPAPTSIYESGEHKGKEKINPHVTRFVLSTGEFCDVFHVKPIYYRHQNGSWRPMSEILSWHGNHKMVLKPDWDEKLEYAFLIWLMRRIELLNGTILIPSPFTKEVVPVTDRIGKSGYATLNFLTLTAYPDPSPETTTVDGDVGDSVSGTSWASVHDLATSSNVNDSGTTANNIADQAAGASGYRLWRQIFLFDTSALGAGASISATTFSMAFDSLGGAGLNDTAQVLAVVQSTPASNTAITTADFDAFTVHSDTIGSDTKAVNFSETAGTYFDFTMTATGRGWVSTTGVTKLGVRRDVDYNDTTSHTLAPAGVTQSHRSWRTADYAGTSSDPKLVVTYTSPITATYTESMTLSDSIVRSITAVRTDSITLTDSTIRSISRTITEVITAADTLLRSISRTVTETITATDTFLGEKVIPVILTEALALSDSIVRSITAVRTEVINMTDTLLRSISRTVTEGITLADTILRNTSRTITEVITAADTLLRSISRTVTESITTNDTLVSAWTAAREFVESISLSDTFSRVWTRLLTLTESIGLTDTIKKLLNGSAVIWRRIARNTSTWRRIDRDNP